MPPTWRQYADYFAIGLLLGLCSANEVVAWGDRLIEDSDCPTKWMIDVSTSGSNHPLDTIHLLALVPGAKDLEISFRLVIAKLAEVYPTLLPAQERSVQLQHRQLFSKLYSLVVEHDDLSDAVRGNIFQIHSGFDCFQEGYGDWSMIQQDYQALLAVGHRYKEWIHF